MALRKILIVLSVALTIYAVINVTIYQLFLPAPTISRPILKSVQGVKIYQISKLKYYLESMNKFDFLAKIFHLKANVVLSIIVGACIIILAGLLHAGMFSIGMIIGSVFAVFIEAIKYKDVVIRNSWAMLLLPLLMALWLINRR